MACGCKDDERVKLEQRTEEHITELARKFTKVTGMETKVVITELYDENHPLYGFEIINENGFDVVLHDPVLTPKLEERTKKDKAIYEERVKKEKDKKIK